ncbi:E3.2.1.4 [Mytilus edulis]|uniref:Endoglucanase n=1 Tax=Mytilus edulis TaxID=6550 RepID=A0A8S3T2D8_MYTED|nr:E3.2.1.4 [Mytilus edulis]
MIALLVLTALLSINAEDQGVYIDNQWDGGFAGHVLLHPAVALHGWTIHVKFDHPVDKLETWVAALTSTSSDKTEFVLTNKDYDKDVLSGGNLKIDFVARASGTTSLAGKVTIEGQSPQPTGTQQPNQPTGNPSLPPVSTNNSTGSPSHSVKLTPPPGVGGSKMKYDYGKAMGLSILFYDAQRSGKLPGNNPIPWRGDSAMGDNGDGHDLTGGWYDAGDHVKFNLPMAMSAHVLGWGLEKFKDAYEHAGKLNDMYDCLRTPLDYFLKCWIPSQQTYWVQVGDGGADHAFWGRAEDMHMGRPAYKIHPGAPGSDAAGNTVAALAIGAVVFKEKDAGYSAKLLEAAKSLYEFAKSNPGIYSNSVPQAKAFYGSSGFKDEMCEAAAELYKATKDQKYLTDAKSFYDPALAWGYSWDAKQPGCQLLLWELTQEAKYKTNMEEFIAAYAPGGSVPMTPCGLTYRDKWGSNRYAANAAFIAVIAVADGIGGDKFLNYAMSQINYILGDNNKHLSYEIGFGNNYPKKPHHRGAACKPGWCAPSWQDSPHILYGGLCGGPGPNDDYQDNRDDYVKNEVACDFNAGFQTACAGLYHFAINNQLPPSPPAKC